MQWPKYANLVATQPVIAGCLEWLVGPSLLIRGGKHPKFTLQQWVEQQLDYVAVRPWERLSMNVVDMSADRIRTEYSVFYHIGGNDRVNTRIRCLSDYEEGTKPLSQVFDDIVEWYQMYWAKQPDRPLVIDAVACKTTRRPDSERYYKEAIQIWPAPEGFRP